MTWDFSMTEDKNLSAAVGGGVEFRCKEVERHEENHESERNGTNIPDEVSLCIETLCFSNPMYTLNEKE